MYGITAWLIDHNLKAIEGRIHDDSLRMHAFKLQVSLFAVVALHFVFIGGLFVFI